MSGTNSGGAEHLGEASDQESTTPVLVNIGTLSLFKSEWKKVTYVCLSTRNAPEQWIFDVRCGSTTYEARFAKSDCASLADVSNAIRRQINEIVTPVLVNIGTLSLFKSEWKNVTYVCLSIRDPPDQWVFDVHCGSATYEARFAKREYASLADASDAIHRQINEIITGSD